MQHPTNDLHKRVYQALRQTNPELAQEYYKSEFNPPKKKKIHVWPLKFNWWHDEKFDSIKDHLKFLEPILIEIMDKRYRFKYNDAQRMLESDFIREKHMFRKGEKSHIPAFMKPNCKIGIAKRVRCSESSVKDYLRALVRIGAMKVDNFGAGRIYYSAGYWDKCKFDDGTWGKKVTPYLNKKMAKKLVNPNEFYLRK